MTTRHALAAAALTLTLAGCGGGGSDFDADDPRSIAEALVEGGFACDDITDANMIGPKDAVECKHGDTNVSVSVFTSGEDRDQLLDQVEGALGTVDPDEGGAVKGDPAWLVTVGSQDEAEQVQEVLGGETV